MAAPQLAMPVRRMLRLAADGALKRLQTTLAGTAAAIVSYQTPGDWNTPPDLLPAVRMRCGDERKQSTTKGQSNFNTSVGLEIEGRVDAATQEAAQDAIELLLYNVENAVLGDPNIQAMIEQDGMVETKVEVTAEGKKHIGAFKMLITAETFEEFDVFDPTTALTAWPATSWPPTPATPASLTDVEVQFTDPSLPGAGESITLPI